ncbi:MAG TPA: hypothetical protein PL005_13915 [Candidatus Hydrogenedentes bacterium]|nr:hypothetical protein [Candidatus Hydrogenedentota bacterium]
MARERSGIRRPFLFNGPFLSLLLCACAAFCQPAPEPAVETPEAPAESGAGSRAPWAVLSTTSETPAFPEESGGSSKANGASATEVCLVFEVADLVALAGAATRADFLNLVYDKGEGYFSDFGRTVDAANGIPDAAEIALLEMVLKRGVMALGGRKADDCMHATRAYNENRVLARSKLPEYSPQIHRAFAALLTAGASGHTCHAEWLAWKISGRKTDFSERCWVADDLFQPDDNLDGDDEDNLEEWERAVEELGPDATPGELMARYVHLAGRELREEE